MSEKKVFTEAEEIKNILLNATYIPWDRLKGKTIFVTGGTGLVGSTFIKLLLCAEEHFGLNLKIYALVRNITKAKNLFSANKNLHFILGDLENIPELDFPINYILHSASPTASQYFAEHPVETVKTAVGSTIKLLDIAKNKAVESFVYLSSMEVYGERLDDAPVHEDDNLLAMPLRARSCYPQSKLLCENLCVDYYQEYGVPCKIVRLAQTFGIGVPKNDNRVFAQFARAAINGTDIELQTPGTTKQCYLYTLDSATAILTVLLCGNSAEAYNAANPETYCSIREMAELVSKKISDEKISVLVNLSEDASKKYPPAHKWNLSAEKLFSLGWKPTCDLEQMYLNLIIYMKGH